MRVLALVQLTFKELMREKIFYVVLLLTVFVLALSFALGALSFSEQKKILADFGFLAMELCSMAVSVFFGSYMVAREIERQTCLLVLARPVSRGQFIFGKYLGLMCLNGLVILALSLILGCLLNVWAQPSHSLNLFFIALSVFLKAGVMAAVAFACAQFVRPVLALLFAGTIYLLGHWLEDLRFFAEKSTDSVLKTAVDLADWCCPDFYRMNWKSWYYLEKGPSSLEVSWAVLHSFGWILVLVVLMQVLFRRKDIV